MSLALSREISVSQFEPNKGPKEFRLVPRLSDTKNQWKKYLPVTYWLPRYQWKDWLIMDIIAAITDVVMVIPQSMGYALVAGLPPIKGLYSAVMGHCLYGPFASSGQLIVSTTAIISLMTKETLAVYVDVDEDDSSKMAAYASLLAFQSGVICVLLGLCKAGVLADMLSPSVIAGFTFAAAILIGISQLTFVFQVPVKGGNVIERLISFFGQLVDGNAHGGSVILALCGIVLLLIVKYYGRSNLPHNDKMKFIPTALILVTIATVVSGVMGDDSGFDVVGELPDGLPKPVNFFDHVDLNDFWAMWIPAMLVSILSFIESVAVASKFADKHGYSINASQELLALGICNLVGCWFQIYPVSGVLSLTTVVEAAGATTPLYGMIGGVALILVCSFALSLFTWLPKPVLGSIVLVGIMGLVDTAKIKNIYSLNRRDFSVTIVTILVTLLLGIDFGVMLGVVASVILFMQKGAKPNYAVLGRLKDEESAIYRDVKEFPETVICRPDMLMIRWDAPIFFANVNSFKTRVRKHVARYLEKKGQPKPVFKPWCLVLDMAAVSDVDFSGIQMLKALVEELLEKEKNMTMLMTHLKTSVEAALTKGHVIGDDGLLPKEQILWELHEAEKWWDEQLVARRNKKQSFEVKVEVDGVRGAVTLEPERTSESHINIADAESVEKHSVV